MTAQTLGIRQAFTADYHNALPRLSEITDAVPQDLGEHPAIGITAVAVAAGATAVYSFGTVVEAGLVAVGQWAGHKYGIAAGGAVQAAASGAIELVMGTMTYASLRGMPHVIDAYARIKYAGDKRIKNKAMTFGRYAGIGFFLGTPGIMIDSVLRRPDRTAEAHAKRGAVALGALAALNGAIGSGITGTVEGVSSQWSHDRWHGSADWLRKEGAGGVTSAVSKIYELAGDGLQWAGEHGLALGAGAASLLALYGAVKGTRLAGKFEKTRQAIKDRRTHKRTTPEDS